MNNIELTRSMMRAILATYTSYRQLFQRKLRRNNIDLTYEMFQILYCLWEKEGVNQQDLANQTIKDKASLTYLINNLEKRNLVERRACDIDGRNKNIYLTPHGKDLQSVVMPLSVEIYSSITEKLNTEHSAACLGFIRKLNNAIKDEL